MKKKKKISARADAVSVDEKRKPNIWLLLLLVCNTALIFGFYRYMLNYHYFEAVLIAYMVVFAALVFGYVIYNRGFSRNGITAEMLPDSMTEEEKNSFIEDAYVRKKRSKWMLTLIFPFVFTFGFEAITWFVTDNILSIFKG